MRREDLGVLSAAEQTLAAPMAARDLIAFLDGHRVWINLDANNWVGWDADDGKWVCYFQKSEGLVIFANHFSAHETLQDALTAYMAQAEKHA